MHHKMKAFTMIELVLAIVIISIALTGTLLVFTTVSRTSADPMITHQGIAIAKSYLSEILTKDFPTTVPCPAPPGGGRSVYNSVCDYSGLSDTGAEDQNGNAITGLEAYTVNVTVDTASASLGSLTSGTQVVRVDVTVQHSAMPDLVLSGYRTQF